MHRIHRTARVAMTGVLLVLAEAAFTGCTSHEGQVPVGGAADMPKQGSGQVSADTPAMTDAGYMIHPQHMAAANTMLPAFASTPDLARCYTFAYRHPEVLSYMPCSCGCATMGHASNWNCYVRSVDANYPDNQTPTEVPL